jgi:hypothetical protein
MPVLLPVLQAEGHSSGKFSWANGRTIHRLALVVLHLRAMRVAPGTNDACRALDDLPFPLANNVRANGPRYSMSVALRAAGSTVWITHDW